METQPPDENNTEGAICCTIQGQQILGYEHWHA